MKMLAKNLHSAFTMFSCQTRLFLTVEINLTEQILITCCVPTVIQSIEQCYNLRFSSIASSQHLITHVHKIYSGLLKVEQVKRESYSVLPQEKKVHAPEEQTGFFFSSPVFTVDTLDNTFHHLVNNLV